MVENERKIEIEKVRVTYYYGATGRMAWTPHERCIRRLTGGAIKSRQQTDRQSPLCTP